MLALLDSGSNQAFVKEKFVPSSCILQGRYTTMQGVNGPKEKVPIACVKIRSPKFGNDAEFKHTVGVCKYLPYDVLLGNNFS